MKNTMKKMLKTCLSMVLVLCMMCGMFPTAAWASETEETEHTSTVGPAKAGVQDINGDGIITYVSFGDSVTNGYGMDGYRYEDGTNVYGFRREPAASYPALIRDSLTEQGYTVDLEQMAISGGFIRR